MGKEEHALGWECDCIIEEDLGNKYELDAFLQDVPDCSGRASGLCVYAEGDLRSVVQGLLTRGRASGEDDGTMTYLVKLVLASLGVIDGGAIAVLEEVSCRDEPISACEGASASAMLRLRDLGGGGSVRSGVESGRGEVAAAGSNHCFRDRRLRVPCLRS